MVRNKRNLSRALEAVDWYCKGKAREGDKERVSYYRVFSQLMQGGREQIEKGQHVSRGVTSNKNSKKAMGLRKGEDQQKRLGMMIRGAPNIKRKALMSSWSVMSSP